MRSDCRTNYPIDTLCRRRFDAAASALGFHCGNKAIVAARRHRDKVIAHPFGEPLRIVDRRFPEPQEIADIGASTLDRASAHRADRAGIDAQLLSDVRNERGSDRGSLRRETSCALKEFQEQRKVKAVRVAPRVAQFALFSGECPGFEIAIDRRFHQAPPVHSLRSAADHRERRPDPVSAVARAMFEAV